VQPNNIIMLGATGAVGNQVALTLSKMSAVNQLTLLGRRPVENIKGPSISQHEINIFSPQSYEPLLAGHNTAICTLGVGQPSKVSKEEFVKIDKEAVLNFACACKNAGVSHFQLLSSVGANSGSNSLYLCTKGQLEDSLKELGFDKLSIFQPSMIITPTNRYGLSQAIALAVMPLVDPLLLGSFKKFRSIKVETLGRAMGINVFQIADRTSTQIFHWNDFIKLSEKQ
jgi:nucleoside-diphosphate-sugar epimerase